MEYKKGYISTSLGKITVYVGDNKVYTKDWMKFIPSKKLVNEEVELTLIGIFYKTNMVIG